MSDGGVSPLFVPLELGPVDVGGLTSGWVTPFRALRPNEYPHDRLTDVAATRIESNMIVNATTGSILMEIRHLNHEYKYSLIDLSIHSGEFRLK